VRQPCELLYTCYFTYLLTCYNLQPTVKFSRVLDRLVYGHDLTLCLSVAVARFSRRRERELGSLAGDRGESRDLHAVKGEPVSGRRRCSVRWTTLVAAVPAGLARERMSRW